MRASPSWSAASSSSSNQKAACTSALRLLSTARETRNVGELCSAIAHTRREDALWLASDAAFRSEFSAALVDCFVYAQDANDLACQNWCVVLLADLLPQQDPLLEVSIAGLSVFFFIHSSFL